MSCCHVHLEHWNSRSRLCFLIFCLPVILTVVSRPVAARPRLRHRSSGASQWRAAAASGAECDRLIVTRLQCWGWAVSVLPPAPCTDCHYSAAVLRWLSDEEGVVRPWRDYHRAGQHRDLHHAAGRSPLLSRVVIFTVYLLYLLTFIIQSCSAVHLL